MTKLSRILATVPPVAYAAAYGSAVMQQAGYKGSGMVDYIFAVHNPVEWHRQNLARNGASHYSILRLLGARALARIQETGAGVYFNVPNLQGQCAELDKAKYAVIEHSALCNELTDWKNLYLSGRLQKPVVTLIDCPRLQEARQKNFEMACAAALLLLPERFDETRLYATISAISYTGDPRMSFGEHPDKALQIAASQTDDFRLLYSTALKKLCHHVTCADAGDDPSVAPDRPRVYVQDASPLFRARLALSLPAALVTSILHHAKIKALNPHSGACPTASHEETARRLVARMEGHPGLVAEALPKAIANVVRPAARVQMAKGFFTFGLGTSVGYIGHKISRALAPRMPK